MSSKKSFERRVENLLRSCGADRYADPRRLVRAIEFGVVGLTGVGVNAVVFVYLVGILNIVAAGFVAFFTSVTWSFGVNRVFT
ncbi:MAG: hypothetical protein SV760_08785 [Halobacteria archaeon]|nr:hypothetical protein [Halobacteria archaeon]